MLIGIDASRAFIKNRTGIEEYSYQVIKNFVNSLDDHEVILYLRKNQDVDYKLPDKWKIKVIKCPYLWTQLGLSLELLLHPVDTLFIPAHTVPMIHPKNTIVTIHGLEYEFCPRAYSFWARLYMRWSIKASCRWAKKIIAVSENTKRDLMKLYKVQENKIKVIYEGYDADANLQFPIVNFQRNSKFQIPNSKYLLFIGRLEERKNIVGIIKAFEILKEQYKLPHKLVLAGKFGYGAEKIQEAINNSNFKSDIILPGFVADEEKWGILKNADVFIFPTFYEGFGIPILEAQSAGVPVVAGDNSSILEVVSCHPELYSGSNKLKLDSGSATGMTAILIDPKNAKQIADAAYKLFSDQALREDMIKRGYENVKRFSWEKCAQEIAKILTRG